MLLVVASDMNAIGNWRLLFSFLPPSSPLPFLLLPTGPFDWF